MAGIGPLPKPPGQKRGRGVPLGGKLERHLPPEGRRGPTPRWPLDKASKGELAIWSRLWHTPQAVMWEQLGWQDAVARYVRVVLLANKRNAIAKVLIEARQMEDRLGLSPMAMLRLRWAIDDLPLPADPSKLIDIREQLIAEE